MISNIWCEIPYWFGLVFTAIAFYYFGKSENVSKKFKSKEFKWKYDTSF